MTSYPGTELDLFSDATNWKAYWKSVVSPYLRGEILEVGAGIGSNTALLRDDRQTRWLCLEPDPALLSRLDAALQAHALQSRCEQQLGTIGDIDRAVRFDAILYLDVLEHIADDRRELADAVARLRPGGHLIVLGPAHQSLFSEFDRSIGHHRRYTTSTLASVVPAGMTRVSLRYLDAVGLLLSAGNRVLLRQSMPTAGQIRFWDRVIVPCSRRVDALTGYRAGKSVVGVWRRPVAQA